VTQRVLSNPRQPSKKVTLILICEVSQTSQGVKQSFLDQIHRIQLDTKVLVNTKAYDSPDSLAVDSAQPIQGSGVTSLC
jgi:hypothetical protein